MAHLYNEETISQAIDTKWAGKTVHFANKNAIIAILFHIRIDMKWWKDTLNV